MSYFNTGDFPGMFEFLGVTERNASIIVIKMHKSSPFLTSVSSLGGIVLVKPYLIEDRIPAIDTCFRAP